MKILRRLLLLFALTLSVHLASANDEVVHPLYLWQTENGNATIYLLGSVHMLPPDFYPLPAPVDKAIDHSETLLVEVNLDQLDMSRMIETMVTDGMYLDGSTLDEHIPFKLYERVIAAARAAGIPEEQAMFMRPWLLSVSLHSTPPEDGVLREFSLEFGMEVQVSALFDADQVIELEGMEYQLKLFSELNEKDQIQLLETALVDPEIFWSQVEGIVDAWEEGNDEHIEELLVGENRSTRVFNRRLISNRNHGMVETMMSITTGTSGVYLMMVGTAHFLGDGNIPGMLNETGLKVFRYMSDGSRVSLGN